MSSLRSFAKRVLPLSHPRAISLIRRIRNIQTWRVTLLPWKRRQLRDALQRCRNVEERFAFARDHLRGGALQNLEEIRAAIDYIEAEQPRCFCEIGTANGGTNLLLSQSLASITTIIAVDLFITNRRFLQLFLRPGQTIQLINGSSYDEHTFRDVGTLLGQQAIDLLFIDGDHRYDGVKKDFLLYSQLVREDGLIMFHDIVPDHGSRYGRPTSNCAGDVPLLWNQLKPHFRHREFVRDPKQDGLGLGLLHWSKATPLPDLTAPK
jgi:predicted O-methyltransferase YrrM